MPPALTGEKIPWLIAGVFVLAGIAVVIKPDLLVFGIIVLPALYCIWADKKIGLSKYAVVLMPLALGLIPAFRDGAISYGITVPCGMLMYQMIKKRFPGLSVLLPACFISFAIFAVIYSFSDSKGMTMYQGISEWIKAVMDNMISQYASILSPGDISELNKSRKSIEGKIISVFPAIIVISSIFIMWINLLIANRQMKRFDLKKWACPEWLIVFFILCAVGVLLANGSLKVASLNMILVICCAYFFQGFAVIASFLETIKMWKVLRLFFYLLIITQLYIMMLTILLGLFDNWFYFRKRIKAKGDEE